MYPNSGAFTVRFFERQNLRRFLCTREDTYANHMTSSLGERLCACVCTVNTVYKCARDVPCSINTSRCTRGVRLCSVLHCNGIFPFSFYSLCTSLLFVFLILFFLYWTVTGKGQMGNNKRVGVMTCNKGHQLESNRRMGCNH